jgi:hypothetical protein
MRSCNCHRCGGTINHARDTGRLPWFCQPCVKEKEVERIQARCEVDKARRRELRNPNCRDCDQPLTFDDSRDKMDMRFVCDACQQKTKYATDAQYRLKRGHVPTGTRAEIMNAAAERKAQPITQELLRELFHYEPSRGALIRLSTGKPAGIKKSSGGYLHVKIFGRYHMLHRIAWVYSRGAIPEGLFIDHRDREKANNSLANLRIVSRAQNGMSMGVSSSNALGLKCVFRWRNGYRTKIAINGKQTLIGDYAPPLEAYRAYCSAAKQHFGPFACLQDETEVRRISEAEMQGREQRKPFKQRRLRDRCLLAA